MKPLVCIAIEVKLRELEGLLYLAARCVERGFPVLIGPRARVWRFFKKDAPQIPIFYITKEMSNLDELRTSDMKIFNLDEEGGAQYTADGVTRTPSIPEQDKIEKIFVWGEAYKKYFISEGAKAEKVVATGHPRFDLKKAPFFSLYKDMETKANRPEKYVLFNSNWASAHYMVGIENLKKLHISMGDATDMINDWVSCDETTIRRMVPLIKRIAKAFPSVNVIIRPHPVEDPAHYDEYFDEPNVQAIKEGDSQQWNVNALAVVHRDCATSLEAFIADKAVISFIGEEVLFRESLAILISKWTEDEDEAFALVKQAIEGDGKSLFTESEKSERKKMLQPIIANLDFDAGRAIADELIKSVEVEKNYSLPQSKSFIYRTAKKLRRILKGNRVNMFDLIVKNKFPGLTLLEVKTRIEGFRKSVPELPEMDVTEFDIDTFLISKKEY